MLRQIFLATAIAAVSQAALAIDSTEINRTIPLKDGSTVVVFKDGKMAMEDRYGRPAYMKEGHVMETRDGQQLVMQGNEAWRLERQRWQFNN